MGSGVSGVQDSGMVYRWGRLAAALHPGRARKVWGRIVLAHVLPQWCLFSLRSLQLQHIKRSTTAPSMRDSYSLKC